MNTQITAPTEDQELLKDLSIDELDALAESKSVERRKTSNKIEYYR